MARCDQYQHQEATDWVILDAEVDARRLRGIRLRTWFPKGYIVVLEANGAEFLVGL